MVYSKCCIFVYYFILEYKPPLKKKTFKYSHSKKRLLYGNLGRVLQNGTDSCQIMWNELEHCECNQKLIVSSTLFAMLCYHANFTKQF